MLLAKRRDDVVCAALIVLVAFAVTAPLFAGERLFYGDFGDWFLPARQLLAREIHAGRAPTWNPHVALGVPLLGNPLVGVAYPFALIQLVGDDRFWLGMTVPMHLAIGGLGAFTLARVFGARPIAALVAGIAMTSGAIPLAGAESLYTLWSLAWLPWIFLTLHRALGLNSWRSAIASGACVAMLTLAGDVARLVDVAFLGVALLVAHVVASRGRRAIANLALCSLAALAAALLSAVMLAPAIELLSRSNRLAGWSPEILHRMPLHPWQLVGLLLRAPVGVPLPNNSLFGDALIDDERLWYVGIYPGLAASLFAPFAVAKGLKQGSSEPDRADTFALRSVAVLIVVMLLLSLGSATPFFDAVVGALPPLRAFRFPAKYAGSIAWLLPLLGAVGLESILAGTRARAIAAIVVAACAIALGLATASFAPSFQPLVSQIARVPEIAIPALRGLARDGRHLASIAALFVVAIGLRARHPRCALVVLAVTMLADGVSTGRLFLWTAPHDRIADAAPIAEVLRADAPSRFVRFPPSPPLPLHRDRAGYLLLTNTMARRLDWDVAVGEGVDALTQYADLQVGEVTNLRTSLLYTNAFFVLSELLATDHQLYSEAQTYPPSLPDRISSGRLVEEARIDGPMSAVLYRDTQALPRAAIFRAAVAIEESARPDVALRAIRQNVLQRVAIVDAADVLEGGRPSARDVRALLDEAHVPRVELGASANAIEPVGAAEILATTTTERTVHARVEAPSLLVLADLFYPGWTADLDGQPTTIVRASLLGRGVVIPAGDHLVTFRYRPRSVVVGATISLVSWLIVAVIAATSIVRRGRRG